MQQPCDLSTLQADFTDNSNINLNIVDVVAFLIYIATFVQVKVLYLLVGCVCTECYTYW